MQHQIVCPVLADLDRQRQEIVQTEKRSGMGNCCGREGDLGHETVLVRHKFAWPKTDRVIFGIDRYMSLTSV